MLARFGFHLLCWTAALVAAQLLLGLLGGTPALAAHVPVWTGFALALAAYPAGIAVSGSVLEPEAPLPTRLFRLAGLGVGWGAVMLVMLGWLGPQLGGGAFPRDDPRCLGLVALYAQTRLSVSAAEAAGGPETIERWLEANRLGWIFVSRLAGVLLAVILAWLGVLVGYWSSRTPRVELRRLQQWVIGLCLIVSTYLAGENSWELLVLHAAGPVYPVAWLRVVAPAVLLCGLAWTTLVELELPHRDPGEV